MKEGPRTRRFSLESEVRKTEMKNRPLGHHCIRHRRIIRACQISREFSIELTENINTSTVCFQSHAPARIAALEIVSRTSTSPPQTAIGSISPMAIQQPILILGAGISGLALAQGLLKSNILFRIYERDTHFNLRAQGYRVRIIGPGIEALESVLPPALYSRLEASYAINAHGGSGPSARLNALTAEEIESFFGRGGPPVMDGRPGGPGVGMKQKPESSPEPLNADRMVLRSVLMRGLEEYVEFDKEFSAYEMTPSGVTLRFSAAVKHKVPCSLVLTVQAREFESNLSLSSA